MALALESVTNASLTGKREKGLATKLYYCREEDILTFPSTDGVDFAGTGTISGDIIFNTGKQFQELYCTMEKGELKFTLEGEVDSKTFSSMAEIYIPSMSANAIGFLETTKNDNFVILVRETCGDYRIMGGGCLPVKMESAEGTTGKARGDAKGTTVTFTSVGGIAPIYTGAIQLTPAA